MNNKLALDKFREYTKDLPKNCKVGKKCDEAALQFLQRHPEFTSEHRPLSLRFKRMIESLPGNKATEASMKEWEDSEFISQTSTPSDAKKPKRGRPHVTLADSPCLDKTQTILAEALSAIEAFADKQKLSRADALRMVW